MTSHPFSAAPISAHGGGSDAVLRAFSESRERWRMLVHEGADLAFETDAAGRLLLLAPEIVLGWPAEQLIGKSADHLLYGAPDPNGTPDPNGAPDLNGASNLNGAPDARAASLFNPFRTTRPVRRQRVWLRDAAGLPACLLISAAPVEGVAGAARGLGIDITEQEEEDSLLAATLRRYDAARALARRMRRAALPFASLTFGLGDLISSVDAAGAILLLYEHEAPLRIAAQAGLAWPGPPEALQEPVLAVCAQAPTWLLETTRQVSACGQSLLLCAGTNHFLDRAVLALWRPQNAPEALGRTGWNDAETALTTALLETVLPILEHEQIERETARLSRTDILTGLYNRQGLIAELPRRFERLDREGNPATLMVIGLDKLAGINTALDLSGGDAVLRDAAALLRDAVRPTDLVARVGGDLFAVWLDNADQFTAAERANDLSSKGVAVEDGETGRVTLSIGLAVRASRSFESIESLMHRAWVSMQSVKRKGGASWQVSEAEPSP
ncbi:diguanylate cyclase [Lichenicoccus sp.]|uniref:GGDEF domain-containing protein n=1 Tax=Lichenicoccus sp. TaxID=2781899 RepID=UPI003D0E1925